MCALLPQLLSRLPPIKSIKYKDFSAEFEKDIAALEKKVIASESAPVPPTTTEIAKKPGTVSWEQFFDEYYRIVNSPSSNVEKILSASILVERMLTNVASAFGIVSQGPHTPPRGLVEKLAKENLISGAEMEAFSDFWAIRNKVVHGAIGTLSDEQTARYLDLAWRLVRALA